MPEPLWLYKWLLPDGTIHITTSYTEANEALHSPHHPLVVDSRIRIPPDEDPIDTYEPIP